MAVKRTKKQKQSAQAKRVDTLTYEYNPDSKVKKSKEKVNQITDKKIKQLLVSSPTDIIKDLTKTVLVTFIVVVLLVGIYFVK